MSLRVVHLNDVGIRVSDDGQSATSGASAPYSSPGYALIDPPRIEFGVGAGAQSRLYPLSTHHQFWHRLDMEAFARPLAHFRHNADIAYSHLQEIARDTALDGDVIMAVPGSFSRQQLAVLLGLVRQCPFQVVGLVDAGLALMAGMEKAPQHGLIHVELQLHQVVLTRVLVQGEEIVRDAVAVVPTAGWIQMAESVLQLMTSAFVQQCRFNPQHNARSEQFLFDCLPQWLKSMGPQAGDNEAAGLISLEHNDTVHRARLSLESVRARLTPFYQKIEQQLLALDPEQSSDLVVAAALHSLPGFEQHLRASSSGRRRITAASVATVANGCLAHADQLVSNADSVRFHTRLRHSLLPAAPVIAETAVQPSHLLADHHARPLRDGMIVRLGDIQAEIRCENGHCLLQAATAGVLVNGVPAKSSQRLQLGDRLSVTGSDQHLQLIRVDDGNH